MCGNMVKLKDEVALPSILFEINEGVFIKDAKVCIKFLKLKISTQYGIIWRLYARYWYYQISKILEEIYEKNMNLMFKH